MAAIDMDRISMGRFVLGLGPSVEAWSEGMFGMPYGKPLAHLREVVEAVRLIVAHLHTGELTRYDGEYVNLDFSQLQEGVKQGDHLGAAKLVPDEMVRTFVRRWRSTPDALLALWRHLLATVGRK